tara:strand:+ start:4019 stop:4309 length:291 start_codon:yes stop_codon:yes gene_type:complete
MKVNQSNAQIWQQVIGAMETPSTKMLLSQQGKLKSLYSRGFFFWKTYQAEIEISEKWGSMIQSRKDRLEDAFLKVLNCRTQITLVSSSKFNSLDLF